MSEAGHDFVTPEQLRVGLYVELELGWMAHPFPKGSFKITSERQITTIRSLGLKRIRYVPSRSDPPQEDISEPQTAVEDPLVPPHAAAVAPDTDSAALARQRREENAALLDAQRNALAMCDEHFGAAIRLYRSTLELLETRPMEAAAQCAEMVKGLVGSMLGQGESSIRLLSEGMGDRASMHPVNVTILSLLLGKALGLPAEALQELGMAAFLHDMGKTQLPDRLRWNDNDFSPAEFKSYRNHVAHGVLLAKRLGLSGVALTAIAQHHEMVDASGFPSQTRGEAITQGGKILALVNRYENMCNPARPAAAATPHEALSLIYSQMKARFDEPTLGAFIRMMGVYPPGSVVQLSDGRFALVVSVNSARPLKPRLIVHDPAVPKDQALILDLESPGAPGVRRSLKPGVLPKAAMDYLSPRLRICYFFERAVEPDHTGAGA